MALALTQWDREILTELPLTAALTPVGRDLLAGFGRVVTVGRRSWLWREGDTAESLGFVLEGCLSVERTCRQPVILDLVGQRESVGETGVALGTSYQFDVRALVSSRVLLLPASVVRKLLSDGAVGALTLAGAFADRVLRLSRRVHDLSRGAVGNRLASIILDLAERFGEPAEGSRLVRLPLRREILAAMAATTEESVSRQLARWTRSGILRRTKGGLEIIDGAQLSHLASG